MIKNLHRFDSIKKTTYYHTNVYTQKYTENSVDFNMYNFLLLYPAIT